MNNRMRLIISVLIILSLSTVSLGREIVSKELLDSQYGTIGDWLNVGDRFYRVTYDDGTSEELIVAGAPFLKTAAITEQVSSGNVDSSQCYNAILQYRVRTIQDDAKSYSLNHKIEVWRNDYNMNIPVSTTEAGLFTEFPNWKVAFTPVFSNPEATPTLQTIQVPWEFGYRDDRMAFDVVEYQQKKTGEWIRVVPGIASVVRVNIKWWTTYQSGSGRGDLIPGCSGAPTPSVPTTPAPPTSVSVSSSPSGVTVKTGGESGTVVGTTPFTLPIASGESKILTFVKAGYVTQAKGVSASTSSVSVTLLPLVVIDPNAAAAEAAAKAAAEAAAKAAADAAAIKAAADAAAIKAASDAAALEAAKAGGDAAAIKAAADAAAADAKSAIDNTVTTPGKTVPPINNQPGDEETSYLPIAIIVIVLGGGAYVMFGNKGKGKKGKKGK